MNNTIYLIINTIYYYEELLILFIVKSTNCQDKYGIIDIISKYLSSRKYQSIYFLLLFTFYFLNFINIQVFILPLIKILFVRYLSFKLKLYLQKNRPFVNNYKLLLNAKDIKKNKSYSFPSNSIVNTFSFYYIVFNDIINHIIQINLLNYIIYIFVIIVGYTKIRRGLHYIHDVIFSVLLNIIIFNIFIYLEECAKYYLYNNYNEITSLLY